MSPNPCPQCRSADTEIVAHNGLEFIKCNKCGYDESLYEVVPSERPTQREKGRYTPYKTGGGKRTQKR